MHNENIHILSLTPPSVVLNPGIGYETSNRKWQGIPGIESTSHGKLFATWYTGGDGEGCDNHVLLVTSCDGGSTWSKPVLVIDPPGKVRAFDPVVWRDPKGRLWLFWSQSYTWWNGRGGVWGIRCDKPDAENLTWSSPKRVANGVMMNKPMVRSNGEWFLPTAVWALGPSELPELNFDCGVIPEMKHQVASNATVSVDDGETFTCRGGADVPLRSFDEHMFVERLDGSLWMLVRTRYGIGQSVSTDGGVTWTPGSPTEIACPDSRFCVRRLASGRLLMVNHHKFTGRSHLTASLSEDDGNTWNSHLLLDERSNVSYPDTAMVDDQFIHVIYDRERRKDGEILLAKITEADILAGRLCDDKSFLKRVVNRLQTQVEDEPSDAVAYACNGEVAQGVGSCTGEA